MKKEELVKQMLLGVHELNGLLTEMIRDEEKLEHMFMDTLIDIQDNLDNAIEILGTCDAKYKQTKS